MKKKTVFLVAAGFLLLLGGIRLFSVPTYSVQTSPAPSYPDALERFRSIESKEADLPLCPEGYSRLFSHGHKTDRVFVLLHGLTNAPEQFVPFAEILFASGANVILPRARHAGYADRMNPVQGLQSDEDLVDQVNTSLDIAAGLGDQISIVALSGSAVAAAWIAHKRERIDTIVMVSPFFSLYGFPPLMVDTLAAVLSRCPNQYLWWDDKTKERIPGPSYVYPRFGTRCMTKTIQLSRAVRSLHEPLKARTIHILTTATDIGANNAVTEKWAAHLASTSAGQVTLRCFAASDDIPHDMIDIHQPTAKPQLVYPVILNLLGVDPSLFNPIPVPNPVLPVAGELR